MSVSRRSSIGHRVHLVVSPDVSGIPAVAVRTGRKPAAAKVSRMIVHVGPSHLPLPARLGGAVERRMMELAEAQAQAGERVVVYSGGA